MGAKLSAKNGGYNELLQQNHYYPFGLNMEGAWALEYPAQGATNHYQYNGIELQEDFGLNWNLAFYRGYDPALGRWGQVDPAQELYYSWSPYNVSMCNPIANSDPSGATVVLPNDSRNGNQHLVLNQRIGELRADSDAFDEIFTTLDNAPENIPVRLLYGAERRRILGTATAAYHAGDNAIYFNGNAAASGFDKAIITEEFAHAAQGKILKDITNRRDELLPLAREGNQDALTEVTALIQNAQSNRITEKYMPDGSHSFMEVEAKLIVNFVRHQAHATRHGRNGWDTPAPREIFDSYINNLPNGYTPVTSDQQLNNFYRLQIDFQDHYINLGNPASYQSGSVEGAPMLYNQLTE